MNVPKEAFCPRIPIKKFTMNGFALNTGVNFEIRIAELLFVLGWKNIFLTRKTADWGADILATSPSGEKWVIQCKRYSSSVNQAAIQEVYTAQGSAYKYADFAMVVTNSVFTEQAKHMAKSLRIVELIDHDDLADWVDDANKRIDTINRKYSTMR